MTSKTTWTYIVPIFLVHAAWNQTIHLLRAFCQYVLFLSSHPRYLALILHPHVIIASMSCIVPWAKLFRQQLPSELSSIIDSAAAWFLLPTVRAIFYSNLCNFLASLLSSTLRIHFRPLTRIVPIPPCQPRFPYSPPPSHQTEPDLLEQFLN